MFWAHPCYDSFSLELQRTEKPHWSSTSTPANTSDPNRWKFTLAVKEVQQYLHRLSIKYSCVKIRAPHNKRPSDVFKPEFKYFIQWKKKRKNSTALQQTRSLFISLKVDSIFTHSRKFHLQFGIIQLINHLSLKYFINLCLSSKQMIQECKYKDLEIPI